MKMQEALTTRKKISIVTPCYNEEDNVAEVYALIKTVFDQHSDYQYEHIFIDNASTDRTADILREIAAADSNVKVIVNTRNYGIVRSPYYATVMARGDAVVNYYCDMQDPPELLHDFIREWEAGAQIVLGVKAKSEDSLLMRLLRTVYYRLMSRISEVDHIKHFTGFGLYDQSFIRLLRDLDDPYPYFRGMVAEFGRSIVEIPYVQRRRKKGKTKNNLFTLYDNAMLGITYCSRIPLRITTFVGATMAAISFAIAVGYLVYKLLYWDRFQVGVAPLVIGVFFLSAMQLFFLGIVGEYIGSIFSQVKRRPLIVIKERINFEQEDKKATGIEDRESS